MKLFHVLLKRDRTGTRINIAVWAWGRWSARRVAESELPGFHWLDVNYIESPEVFAQLIATYTETDL